MRSTVPTAIGYIPDCTTLGSLNRSQRQLLVQGEDGPSGSHRRARSSGSVEGHAALRPGLEPISEGFFQVLLQVACMPYLPAR